MNPGVRGHCSLSPLLSPPTKRRVLKLNPVTKSNYLPKIWSENLIFKVGVQGIAHGTVFIVNVQEDEVKSGRSGVIGVSHLPNVLTVKNRSNIKNIVRAMFDPCCNH